MNKLYKGHYLIMALALLVIILAITSWNGCHNANKANGIIALKKAENDSLKKELSTLPKSWSESQKQYRDSLEFAFGQYALKDNQQKATELKLDAANARIQNLLSSHTPVIPSDSTTTLVPNEYINQCADCFTELEGQYRLVNQYRSENDTLNEITRAIGLKYSKRVLQLEEEKKQAFDIASAYQKNSDDLLKRLQPRRTVYLSLSVMGKKEEVLLGFGAGLLYQDKRKRMYGGKAFATTQGTIYMAETHFPLSFRRK